MIVTFAQVVEKPLIEMRDICKNFGAVQALRNVNLSLLPGEILGLVGDNAAGKSTLVKVLNGAYKPDKGEIIFEGHRAHFESPLDSRAKGIEMIYQDFALVECLDITSNIFLGKERTAGLFSPLLHFLLRRQMDDEAQKTINDLGIQVKNLRIKVKDLSGGERQLVAIARGVHFQPKLFIMDEPTANLSVSKIETLLRVERDLKSRGVSMIIISHRLEDIFAVADRIVVLWRGRKAGEIIPREGATMEDLVHLMMFGNRDQSTKE
jgi:ABC-type sugar transport system ATPase subunit